MLLAGKTLYKGFAFHVLLGTDRVAAERRCRTVRRTQAQSQNT